MCFKPLSEGRSTFLDLKNYRCRRGFKVGPGSLKWSSYLGVCNEQTVGVLVFTGDLILRQHVGQLLDKSDHFLVPGDISHGQAAGRALPAVRHSLQTVSTPSE